MIDIMALRQSYERRGIIEIIEIRQINRSANLADIITKAEPNKALEKFITTNTLRVRVKGSVERKSYYIVEFFSIAGFLSFVYFLFEGSGPFTQKKSCQCRDIFSRQKKQRQRVCAPNRESHRIGFRGTFQPSLGDTSIYINRFTFCFWSIHAVHLTVYTVPSW